MISTPLEFCPAIYLHVGVVHVSLIPRVAGDLVDRLGRVAVDDDQVGLTSARGGRRAARLHLATDLGELAG